MKSVLKSPLLRMRAQEGRAWPSRCAVARRKLARARISVRCGAFRSDGYDALSRVVEYTDRRGLVTQFDYDFWGRLVEETWLDGVTTVNVLEYRYDLANNLLETDDDSSAFDFTYDNLSRLLTSVDSSGGPTVRLSQQWDSNSNRAALEAEIDSGGGYAADFLNEYAFDNLSRMTRVEQTDSGAGGVDVSEKRVDFAYNAVNQFTTITRYEDLAATDLVATSTYTYDNAHRLTALTHAKGGTTLADYDWTYDVASRVTSFTNNLYSSETATYAYDHTDQLTVADRTGGGNDEAYAFDENGNRTISGYVTGDGNLLTSDGTFDYEYDDENNRVRKENISTGDYVLYTWDHRNRLVAIEFRDDADDLQKRVEYDYDVFDRRIFKRVDDDGDGNFDRAYRYVYDHAGKFDTATGVPLDDIVLIFTDPDGEGEDDFELSNRLLHGPAVDQVLADEQFVAEVFDDIYWALPDNQGTIRDLVDYNPGNDTTTNAKHLAFASFGEITSDSSPSLDFLYSYTGREWDPDAELYFYRARPLDPITGEFLSEDWINFRAGDTNLRRYVGNSSTNATDPSGLIGPGNERFDEGKTFHWGGKVDSKYKPTMGGRPLVSPTEIHIVTTALSGLQLAAGVALGWTPMGVILMADAIDNLQAEGQFWAGVENPKTLKHYGIEQAALAAGATPAEADAWGRFGSFATSAGIGGFQFLRWLRARSAAAAAVPPKPVQSAADELADTATATSIAGQPAQAPLPQGGNAAARVPQLRGMSRGDAHIAIRNQGFQYHGTTTGGYVRYRHADGSEVWIRPNGEVMRYGPPVEGRPGRPRLDRLGNPSDHPKDEFLPPLPQQGG